MSLVIELQADAINATVKTSELLRKALVVAKKLGVTDFENWVQAELTGYKLTADVPPYRIVKGIVQAWNPYNNMWIPAVFESPLEAERLSKRASGQPIAEIEELAEAKSKGMLQMPFDHATEAALRRSIGLPLTPTLCVDRTALVGTLNAVRNTVLQWALKLEADGIRGEGMTFSSTERDKAKGQHYNVNNFYGPVSQSQISQGGTQVTQSLTATAVDWELLKPFLQSLQELLNTLSLPEPAKSELRAEVATLQAQLGSPHPKAAIVHEAGRSIRNILEGMTGSLIAAKLLEQLARALGG